MSANQNITVTAADIIEGNYIDAAKTSCATIDYPTDERITVELDGETYNRAVYNRVIWRNMDENTLVCRFVWINGKFYSIDKAEAETTETVEAVNDETKADNNGFEQFGELRELYSNIDPRNNVPKNRNERIVFDIALETVGGVENAISDGEWNGAVTYDGLVEMAMQDVFAESPKEVRFVGKDRARALCSIAAALFNA